MSDEVATAHDARIAKVIAAMAQAGQELAVHWGHQPWSDSWARLVAETLLRALESTDEQLFVRSEVSGEGASFCGDCMAPASGGCDYRGHGTVTLGELMEAYSDGLLTDFEAFLGGYEAVYDDDVDLGRVKLSYEEWRNR